MWEEQALFDALLPLTLAHCPGRFVPVALDDTRLKKTGKRIPTAFWQRDPLSPPFRMNLQWGLRFLQASVLLPLHRKHNVNARAIPVRFAAAPSLKKPGAGPIRPRTSSTANNASSTTSASKPCACCSACE